MNTKILFVIGKPGSGKSSVSAQVVTRLNYVYHFSVGNELRAIGLQGKRSRYRGELSAYVDELRMHKPVPPHLSTSVFEECIANNSKDVVIVDGYPQYANLLPDFHESIQRSHAEVMAICNIYITDELARQRLGLRAQRLSEITEDDEYIESRLISYQRNSNAVIEFLSREYPIVTIDGSRVLQDVASDLIRVITTAISQ